MELYKREDLEKYKEIIISLVKSSEDIDYIVAVYSFASVFLEKRLNNNKC